MDTTMEDHMLDNQRKFIELVMDCAFPDDKSPENIAICTGKTPKGIEIWETQPWQMPAVQLWFNLIMKFEGATEHVSGNLMQDYNETAALGLAVKGK
eukprot:426418-Rhodomonas_salina.1